MSQERFERDMLRGSLDLMVLSVLADGSKYGYLIQKRLREVSHDRVDVQAGTLYPLLHRLEADKLIRSRWDDSSGRRRKWYQLTAAGKRRLGQQAEAWQRYAQCVEDFLSSMSDGNPQASPEPT